ncbi:MAG: translation initiation factor eIF-1A [Candidatus Omnitrophica bacterium]|nr:translation initiation factor eIF-1A [Candidatus Omnitrophota bacterium]
MEGGEGKDGEVFRVRIPKGKEILGIVEQRFGGAKMLIRCMDGKSRNCRVPGRYKRSLWLREGDVVLIEPWEFDNSRGDIIFKYTKAAVSWLQRKGFLKQVSEF